MDHIYFHLQTDEYNNQESWVQL